MLSVPLIFQPIMSVQIAFMNFTRRSTKRLVCVHPKDTKKKRKRCYPSPMRMFFLVFFYSLQHIFHRGSERRENVQQISLEFLNIVHLCLLLPSLSYPQVHSNCSEGTCLKYKNMKLSVPSKENPYRRSVVFIIYCHAKISGIHSHYVPVSKMHVPSHQIDSGQYDWVSIRWGVRCQQGGGRWRNLNWESSNWNSNFGFKCLSGGSVWICHWNANRFARSAVY